MKIILEAQLQTKIQLFKELDLFDIPYYSISSDNLFIEGNTAVQKYSLMLTQLYAKEGVFVNSLFSFLLKLDSKKHSVYYKQLYASVVIRVKELMKYHWIIIIVESTQTEIIELLRRDAFEFEVLNSPKDITHFIHTIFS